MRRIGRTCKEGAMTVATSGIILITCDAKSSKKVLGASLVVMESIH